MIGHAATSGVYFYARQTLETKLDDTKLASYHHFRKTELHPCETTDNMASSERCSTFRPARASNGYESSSR